MSPDYSGNSVRHTADAGEWTRIAERLATGGGILSGLWGEPDCVHLAVLDKTANTITIHTLACPAGKFPSVARHHPAAVRLERTITDLFGLIAEGTPDARPWLDHGKWGVRHPLASHPPKEHSARTYSFLPADGESLHQIPVGPVHAGIIEPGHFRFTANGETVVRLEQRLGYLHKGTEQLMAGAPLERAARLAGRVSGDSTVAYALAFAHAVEAASGLEPPPRAVWLRALMAELERLANHCGDIGAVCNDAAFVVLHAQFGWLREQVLRTAARCFGHRLMMDCVVPGGVRADLAAEGQHALRVLAALVRSRFPELVEVYDNTESLKDRTVGTGILTPALAAQFAAGGYVGRASGRAFDARRTPGYG